MTLKAERILLTESQAACLEALRDDRESKSNIAIAARLDLKKTAAALEALRKLRLVERVGARRLRATRRGISCSFEIIPDQRRRSSEKLGPAARRLLKTLDQPMRANELAERLGITSQRVHQLAVRLLRMDMFASAITTAGSTSSRPGRMRLHCLHEPRSASYRSCRMTMRPARER